MERYFNVINQPLWESADLTSLEVSLFGSQLTFHLFGSQLTLPLWKSADLTSLDLFGSQLIVLSKCV